MLFKRKRKIIYGVFAIVNGQEKLAGLYKDLKNAGICKKGIKDNEMNATIRAVGIDF